MATLTAFLEALPYLFKIVSLFSSTDQNKKDDLKNALDQAFEKLKNGDPSDLSKLINS